MALSWIRKLAGVPTTPAPLTAYQLRRSARRTLEISVLPDASVLVRAPLKMSAAAIEGFVRQRRAWIEEKQEEQRRHKPDQDFRFVEGATIHWIGVPRRLRLEAALFGEISLAQADLRLRAPDVLDQARLKKAFLQWRMLRAREFLADRVAFWLARFPTPAMPLGKLRVKDLSSRWGSCAPNGDVSLHAGLLHYAPEAIDYVVVHELAHLTHRNHRKRFYALLTRVLPEWKAGRAKLTEPCEPPWRK